MDTMDNTNGSTKRLDQRIDSLSDEIKCIASRIDAEMKLRSEHAGQLGIAEAKRIDAIRSVDITAVAIANDRAVASAVVLAAQVASSAETLRTLVAQTAQTVAGQLATLSSSINDRISALEKTQYTTSGKDTGSASVWGYIVAGVMTVIAVGSFLLPHLR
jgi:hypothetical protein